MGKKISYVENTQESKVSEKFKNDMIWQEILKNTK
jgi:hypothetical protein